jgi:hypothetical protein
MGGAVVAIVEKPAFAFVIPSPETEGLDFKSDRRK